MVANVEGQADDDADAYDVRDTLIFSGNDVRGRPMVKMLPNCLWSGQRQVEVEHFSFDNLP